MEGVWWLQGDSQVSAARLRSGAVTRCGDRTSYMLKAASLRPGDDRRLGVASESDASEGLLGLADAIGLVRQQLVAAQIEGRRVVAGKVVTFAVGRVMLELNGEIRKAIGGTGEAKFWVLTASARAEHSSGTGHKITIELVPQGKDGETFAIADDTDAPPPR